MAREIQEDPAFCAQMIDGDELWHYANSDESWHRSGGEAGIALVRMDKAVAFKMEMVN